MTNLISVCIATYKRPELLEKLLFSLLNQKSIDEYKLEVIVMDNDVNKTAQPVINKFNDIIKNNSRFSLKYDMQSIKNIALTRNKTVELASGSYLFFIDDDEYTDEFCIYNHLKTLKEFNADISMGNVMPYFELNTADYIKKAYPYFRINCKNGNKTKYFITGNTMISLENLGKQFIKFNLKYGLTGGEDNELFSNLSRDGIKIVSCSSSVAYEFIPPDRANLRWLLRRVFRTGNNYTRTLLQNTDGHFRKITVGCLQFIKGTVQFLIALILSLVLLFFRKDSSLNWLLKSVSNLSKPFAVFGYYPKEYKK